MHARLRGLKSGQKVKLNFFRTWSCCISNLLESRNVATWYQIFCPQPPTPLTLAVKINSLKIINKPDFPS